MFKLKPLKGKKDCLHFKGVYGVRLIGRTSNFSEALLKLTKFSVSNLSHYATGFSLSSIEICNFSCNNYV